ncbi:MAG TPA: hypothetical protein VFV77_10220 [Gammaproteobacteria bacterium]|nr:hypothetical protein [Gammaproteobacteria bacterium]
MLRFAYPLLAATLLLAGCASTQTTSPDLTVTIPSTADAKWTFSAVTTWADPVRISITINGSPLPGKMEVSPGDIIGVYQGHAIRAQCKTEWTKGAAFGSGTCYIYVDGIQTGILLL